MTESMPSHVASNSSASGSADLRSAEIAISNANNLNFAHECQRQSKLVAKADSEDIDTLQLMTESISNLNDWSA